ncbi:unnamed protein product [Ilex paraguariensis]|uniref:Uncharacterized protein n=1 Tax=Ilex paraguariensis TaxID=185542 RepID=A0ABC8TK76_9AQUA
MAAKKEFTSLQLELAWVNHEGDDVGPIPALAWVNHEGDDVGPIPDTAKIENLDQNIGALSVKLTTDEMVELEFVASEVKGDRYPATLGTWRTANTPPLSSWKAE